MSDLPEGMRWCPECGGEGEVWVMEATPDMNEHRHDCTYPGCAEGKGIVPVGEGGGRWMTSTYEPKPADQDLEYLHEAHVILCRALAGVDGKDGNPNDWHDVATELLDALVAHGWHLFNAEDARTFPEGT